MPCVDRSPVILRLWTTYKDARHELTTAPAFDGGPTCQPWFDAKVLSEKVSIDDPKGESVRYANHWWTGNPLWRWLVHKSINLLSYGIAYSTAKSLTSMGSYLASCLSEIDILTNQPAWTFSRKVRRLLLIELIENSSSLYLNSSGGKEFRIGTRPSLSV